MHGELYETKNSLNDTIQAAQRAEQTQQVALKEAKRGNEEAKRVNEEYRIENGKLVNEVTALKEDLDRERKRRGRLEEDLAEVEEGNSEKIGKLKEQLAVAQREVEKSAEELQGLQGELSTAQKKAIEAEMREEVLMTYIVCTRPHVSIL